MLAYGRKRRLANRASAAMPLAILVFATLLPVEPLRSAAVENSIVVREHSGWDRNCEAIPYPPLSLITPPSHGKVCAKAQVITIASMFAGTESQCIGRDVSGVRIIYQPDASYRGEDTLVYGVQYPSRFRAVSVKVNIGATVPATVSVADADVAAQPKQAPGPMPTCPQYVF
ncbi:hypothetical protein [Pseudolabrys sp. FHR47]|uniref:hypothetical protein n=1 Tax=Pseudolabrys sp. FHR47 TaxID=2562284 RepID=UPI0010BE4C12|nr:hypothetical protein [Pseudolabrys sp. FHR47]